MNKCNTGEMAKPVKDVFSVITQMQIQRRWRKEPGQIQTSWKGAGQTELAVKTGAPLSFRTLKGKRKDEKQHSEIARKSVWGKLFTQYFCSGEFPRNCNQDAGYWVSLAPHTYITASKSWPSEGTGFPLRHVRPFRSSFKEGVSGLFTVLRFFLKNPLQHRTPKNTLQQGRSLADRQKQREERGDCVWQTDDGHAHTVGNSFTAPEAPNSSLMAVTGWHKS